ncbi:GntR family transcriptional regulator [Vibrio penaeicida]|uniref:GntR family transcriptional regulator n=1 Tax=Vibrio penaeicida TaxID=104609 RepID=UPI00273440D8|nr:GntR family transcriptional regulator [Vibrio penaeicida]MDP2571719.1 GntR family transcriptional regulator [Vibrio penaeicida]
MNLAEVAYKELRDRIVSNSIKPNEKLDISQLQTKFGFSKAPIVDALSRLRDEGLVISRHRVGTFTAPLSRSVIEEVFEARSMIEYWITPTALHNVSNRQIADMQKLIDEASVLLQVAEESNFDYPRFMQIDHQFHMSIIQLAEMSKFEKWFDELTAHMTRARHVFDDDALQRSREGQQEHITILNVISKRDVEETRKQLLAHTRSSRDSILGHL